MKTSEVNILKKISTSSLGEYSNVLNKANLYGNRDHVKVIKLYSELKKGPRFVETCRKI